MANTNGESQHLDRNGLVKPILSHEIVQAYLKDELSQTQNQKIESVKSENEDIEIFFHLLDELKSKAVVSQVKKRQQENWLTHSQLEKVIYKVFTGEISDEEARTVVQSLLSSPTIYRKFLTKAGETIPEKTELPEMSEIELKSNEEILDEMGVSPKVIATDVIREANRESWLRRILDHRISVPSYAYLVPAMALLIIFIITDFNNSQKYYVYDDQVPVPFSTTITTFRDISSSTGSQFETFKEQFLIAMRDYEQLHYEDAVRRMEQIRPMTESVLRESEHENAAMLVKDYYFYLGITHFALFRNHSDEMTGTMIGRTDSTKIAHGNKAIEYLQASREVAEKNDLPLEDRNHFFLALAYGFANQAQAQAELKRIAPESPYFEESRELLEKWKDD